MEGERREKERRERGGGREREVEGERGGGREEREIHYCDAVETDIKFKQGQVGGWRCCVDAFLLVLPGDDRAGGPAQEEAAGQSRFGGQLQRTEHEQLSVARRHVTMESAQTPPSEALQVCLRGHPGPCGEGCHPHSRYTHTHTHTHTHTPTEHTHTSTN